MRILRFGSALIFSLGFALTVNVPNLGHAQQTWSEQTTAAAMGYCLARHPYIARSPKNPFTAEGFEILASPGVLGAVRRNYVFQRKGAAVGLPDSGQNQTCAQACSQFGLNYGSATAGRPLMFRDKVGNVMADGIGDMASLAYRDFDYYNNDNVIAGMWGRPLNFHESDVAQADFCCCQLDTSQPPPPKDRVCVDFEQPLLAGTRFGSVNGNTISDQIFTQNGIAVTIEEFTQASGNRSFNEAIVDTTMVPGGTNQSLRLNNVSVRFDVTGLPFVPSLAEAKYLDFGGIENLSANGDVPLVDHLENLSGGSTGGNSIALTATANGKSYLSGTIHLQGKIKDLTLGGQEFWIDQVCFAP